MRGRSLDENPAMSLARSAKPTWSQIRKAHGFLRDRLPSSRVLRASSLRRHDHASVYFKLETETPTGSFKVRGAPFALHAEIEERPVTEVVAASTRNHGAAVAYAARLLSVPAKIFVPCPVNEAKHKRIQELGALIVEDGKDITEARTLAAEYSNQKGCLRSR
jgi:threonine dehydratase